MVNDKFLIELLREDVKETEQELNSLRSSLRYQVGDTVLKALPLSVQSFRVLPRLFELYRSHGKANSFNDKKISDMNSVIQKSLSFDELGLGKGFKNAPQLWTTTDAELMALRLRSAVPVTSIVLRTLSVTVVRQLARYKLAGTKIVWWPDPNAQHSADLEAYIVALADQSFFGDVL